MSEVFGCLKTMLEIESPTYQEQAFVAWMSQQASDRLPDWHVTEYSDCLIIESPVQPDKPHIALVGHSDVVPAYVEPFLDGDKLFGSGASDMKGALAAFWVFVCQHHQALLTKWNISLIVYSREEQTPLHENGLYHLLQTYPDYFKRIDLAIVGEPTDNTIQLGCVGSMHATVTVPGQACHSARPWNGKNALYQALPFIQHMAAIEPVKHTVFGLDFFDVYQITESQSEPGRTSLPGWWRANVNYRFAPVRTEAHAQDELRQRLIQAGIVPEHIEIFNSVPAGDVIESDLFKQIVKALDAPLQAKQAWTDVAQLTAAGIPAFNFGPGLTSQAHKVDEHILVSDLEQYLALLRHALLA